MKAILIWMTAVPAACLAMALAGCADKSASPARNVPSTNPPGASAGNSQANTNAVPPPTPGWNPGKAQPTLPTLKLYVGREMITAELAMTEPQIRTGMMYRESMAENAGMLFVFAGPYRPAFYMKNTKVPLDAAYIDPDGVIQEIVDLNPFNETPVEAQSNNIQFVLEMNQGWFKRHNISTGAVLTTERGPLLQVFGRR